MFGNRCLSFRGPSEVTHSTHNANDSEAAALRVVVAQSRKMSLEGMLGERFPRSWREYCRIVVTCVVFAGMNIAPMDSGSLPVMCEH